MPHDIATAMPIVEALRQAGFDAKLVGSVAKFGQSDHDIDILVPFWLTAEEQAIEDSQDSVEWIEVRHYRGVMRGLGFESECLWYDDNEVWVKQEEETGKILVVDLFPELLEGKAELYGRKEAKAI